MVFPRGWKTDSDITSSVPVNVYIRPMIRTAGEDSLQLLHYDSEHILKESGKPDSFLMKHIMSMHCIGRDSFLQNLRRPTMEAKDVCQCPVSGETHFYSTHSGLSVLARRFVSMPCIGRDSFLQGTQKICSSGCACVNALYRAGLISTPPLQKSSVYAGCSICFCRYFSEYSDNSPKQGPKVGRAMIVFFEIQSCESFYTPLIANLAEEAN